MIVVDSTVLVYAVGAGGHPLRDPSRLLVERVRDREIEAVTTAQVVLEFAHVRVRHRDRHDAARLAGAYATLFAPLLRPDAGALEEGLRLFRSSDGLGAFDAVLVATTKAAGATLVSADTAFAGLRGLSFLHLGDAGFERRLQQLR